MRLLKYRTPFVLGHDGAPKPTSLSLHEAGAVALVSLAAWQALVDRATCSQARRSPRACRLRRPGLDRHPARQAPRRDGGHDRPRPERYDAGHLRPLIDRTFPFEQTVEALAYAEQGRARGKVVVTLD